jgi:antitoxin ChpS
MHTTTLRKVGGSVMLAIPRAVLDMLQLQPGTSVGLVAEGGRLIVEPRRHRYTLEQLLAQCDPSAAPPQADHDWLDAAPVGGELL